ncbi:MAG: hypothetical protein HY908_14815, partial [Myxococcales bacterium]|nr:hypothetical protein [Myxococcales bacterium]
MQPSDVRRAGRYPAVLVASGLASLALARAAGAEPPPAVVGPDAAVTVELLAMPAVGPVRSIAGTSARDVWILGDDASVVHHDGARVLTTDRGVCQPRPKPGADAESVVGPDMRWVVSGPRGPEVVRSAGIFDDYTPLVVAERSAGGWACKDRRALSPQVLARGGGTTWHVACSAPSDVYCNALTLDGPGLAPDLPRVASPVTALWLGGPAAGWLARADGTFDWNGVGWHRRGLPPGFALVWQLWQDEDGIAWALGASLGLPWKAPERLDRAARFVAGRWEPVGLPQGFEPRVLAGTGRHTAWLLGDGVGYAWDGGIWRRATLPPATVRAAWSAGDGSLWVGGSTPSA